MKSKIIELENEKSILKTEKINIMKENIKNKTELIVIKKERNININKNNKDIDN